MTPATEINTCLCSAEFEYVLWSFLEEIMEDMGSAVMIKQV